MNNFQQQFQKYLMLLDKQIGIGLSPKQIITLSQNITEGNFLKNLKKNTQAEKIRMRPVKLAFKENSFITTPLLILRKNNTFALMICKNNKNWFLDTNNQMVLVSDFGDIQLALQFYPDIPLNSLMDLVRFFFRSTGTDFQKTALICLILVITASIIPLCFTGMLNAVIPFHDLTLWVQISILLVVAVFIMGGFELVKRLFLLQTILKRCEQGQASLWNKLFRLYPGYFSRHSVMNSVLSAQSLDQIRDVIDIVVISNFFNLIFSLLMIALLFYYSLVLAIIVLVFLLIIILCFYFLYRHINTYLNKAQEIRIMLMQFTLEIFKGIEKIKLANAGYLVLQKWLSIFLDKKKYDVSANQHFIYMMVITRYLLLGIFFCFFYIFTWGFNIISLDNFLGFSVTYGIIINEVIDFANETYVILIAFSLLNRSKIITDEKHIEKQSGIRPLEFKGRIQIEDLSLDIEEQRIVSRVSFEVSSGKTIAIVGLSGSGKTTLLRSILGLVTYPPQSIIIDDIALENLNLNWYRMHCGVVLQNSELINGSILENITLGDEYDEAEIEALCTNLNLSAWLNELPMKLGTRCMGGQELISGGQKQLILLARALIRKPVFLFLDEATSSLDNVSQQAVIQTIKNSDATKVIIAHRFETIYWADEILVLEQGKVVERGNYHDLLDKKGKFFELSKNQVK